MLNSENTIKITPIVLSQWNGGSCSIGGSYHIILS